jgi:hypothetical protein
MSLAPIIREMFFYLFIYFFKPTLVCPSQYRNLDFYPMQVFLISIPARKLQGKESLARRNRDEKKEKEKKKKTVRVVVFEEDRRTEFPDRVVAVTMTSRAIRWQLGSLAARG